jgi:HEAT repeat protein
LTAERQAARADLVEWRERSEPRLETTMNPKTMALGLALGTLLAAAPARAQEKAADPEQQLAKAKLLCESQHDYQAACALAMTISSQQVATDEQKTQALILAAQCRQHLGQADDGKKLLTLAAAMKTASAKRAQELLGAGGETPLQDRIAKLVAEVGKLNEYDYGEFSKQPSTRDLLWIGEPAVPALAQLVQATDRLGAASAASYLLVSIGGDAAAVAMRAALQNPDPFFRRAVILGWDHTSDVEREPMRSAVLEALHHPDPRVRKQAISRLARSLLDFDAASALTEDPDPTVQAAAWEQVVEFAKHGRPDNDPLPDSWVDRLDRALHSTAPELRRAASNGLTIPALLRTPRGVRVVLEQLAAAGADDDGDTRWFRDVKANSHTAPAPLDLLIRAKEALQPWPTGDRRRDRRQELLASLVQASCSQPGSGANQIGWSATEKGNVFELMRRGPATVLLGWLSQNLEAADMPRVLALAAADGWAGAENILSRFDLTSVPDAVREEMVASLLKINDRYAQAERSDHPNSRPDRWTNWHVMSAVARLAVASGDRAIVQVARDAPTALGSVVSALLDESKRPASSIATSVYETLITIDDVPAEDRERHADPWKYSADRRDRLVAELARRGAAELLPILPEAYRLGLPTNLSSQGFNGSFSNRGLDHLFLPENSSQPRWENRFPAADAWKCVAACLSSGGPVALEHLAQLVPFVPPEVKADPQFQEVARDALQQALSAGPADAISSAWIVARLMSVGPPGWEEIAVQQFDGHYRGFLILQYVPTLTNALAACIQARPAQVDASAAKEFGRRVVQDPRPELRPALLSLLSSPFASVRQDVIESLSKAWPSAILDIADKVTHDADASVRQAAYSALAATLDRRAVPVLIEALHDQSSVKIVRDALDELQYYLDTKEKWRRVLDGAGLDAPDAAEALVKQAAADQPKATRLVAIESLGTLGVAETLPILIRFMGESDAEIAAAAKGAVERITRRAAEKEKSPGGDAPASKDGKSEKQDGGGN